MRPPVCTTEIALVQSGGRVDHFVGVPEALRRRGVGVTRYFVPQSPPLFDSRTRVVAVADLESFLCLRALRLGKRYGARTVLLMDGLVEFRNTFLNRRNHPEFLRPAPVDVICAAGEVDRRRLIELGNPSVIASGLPRICHSLHVSPIRPPDQTLNAPRRLLIATARQPWFNPDERDRLLRALALIRDHLQDRRDIQPVWRVAREAAGALRVINSNEPLRDLLKSVQGALTTPSTLIVEAMRAALPCAVLNPFDAPLWTPCVWQTRGADAAEFARTLDSLLAPTASDLTRQRELLNELHPDAPAADAVANVIIDQFEQTHSTSTRTSEEDSGIMIARIERQIHEAETAAQPTPLQYVRSRTDASPRRRVLSLVAFDESPIGGVTTWSRRLARSLAQSPHLGYDMHTLFIAPKPRRQIAYFIDHEQDGIESLFTYDPTADHIRILARLAGAIEEFAPDIILPNYLDLCYAAAIQARDSRADAKVRLIAVAHTDDAYYRGLIRYYHTWDAAVAVSSACAAWLAPLAGARPLDTIVYGVPIGAEPSPAPHRLPQSLPHAAEPLRLAYIGRMTQNQKRIFDLVDLLDELHRSRGTSFEFHLIGDGDDLDRWLAIAATRSWRNQVVVHGSLDEDVVQAILGRLDMLVLVSEAEGASLSMLEAMAQGVVPAVTAVSSGVGDWIRDGDNGIIAQVGDMSGLAIRISALANDRDRLAAMKRAAWSTVAGGRASIQHMTQRYAALFDRTLAITPAREAQSSAPTPAPTPQQMPPRPPRASDLGWRLIEHARWAKHWSDDPAGGDELVRDSLHRIGFQRIARSAGELDNDHDAVIVNTSSEERPPSANDVCVWRSAGVGVVITPSLVEPVEPAVASNCPAFLAQRTSSTSLPCAVAGGVVALRLDELIASGARRIAVYGLGRHTERFAPLFQDRDHPIVGFIDDDPSAPREYLGRPVASIDDAMERLAPDAVILSSDAWETTMYRRARAAFPSFVRIATLYRHRPAADDDDESQPTTTTSLEPASIVT